MLTSEGHSGNPEEPEAPTPADVCAILIAYHPDAQLAQRCLFLAPLVARFLIVDNSTSVASQQMVKQAATHCGADRITLGDNLGVAAALNIGAQWARSAGYRWAISFDQDSVAREEIISTLSRIVVIHARINKVGCVGAKYERPEDVSDDWGETALAGYIEKEAAITSGCLFSLDAWAAVGGFWEGLFIDELDHEFCWRLARAGYSILQSQTPLLYHQVGESRRVRLLRRSITIPSHSALRRYYQARNRILVARRHGKGFPWRILFLKILGWSLLDKQPGRKLLAFLIGIWQGLRGTEGRASARVEGLLR